MQRFEAGLSHGAGRVRRRHADLEQSARVLHVPVAPVAFRLDLCGEVGVHGSGRIGKHRAARRSRAALPVGYREDDALVVVKDWRGSLLRFHNRSSHPQLARPPHPRRGPVPLNRAIGGARLMDVVRGVAQGDPRLCSVWIAPTVVSSTESPGFDRRPGEDMAAQTTPGDVPPPPSAATPGPAPGAMAQPRRLFRSRNERMLAGVCGGLAEYMNWDPRAVQIAFLLSLLRPAPRVIAYLIA